MIDQELKVRGRLICILTLYVRKSGMCHRRAWKAYWQFPNVTRQEQNTRRMAILFLTLYVRNTRMGHRGPSRVTEWPGRAIGKFLTLHVRSYKWGEG